MHNIIRINRILLASLLVLLSLGTAVVFQSQTANAQSGLVCDGLSPGEAGGSCDTASASEPNVDSLLESVLDILSLAAGVIAVIMVIIGATKFITSQGDASKVASARTTIIYALVGLIVVALAQTIIFFVVDKVVYPDTSQPTQTVCPDGQTCPQ